jgi:hypothetical protein
MLVLLVDRRSCAGQIISYSLAVCLALVSQKEVIGCCVGSGVVMGWWCGGGEGKVALGRVVLVALIALGSPLLLCFSLWFTLVDGTGVL